MSIEILFLASFTLIGGALLARVAIRSIERGRLAIAPEYKAKRIRAGKKLLPAEHRLIRPLSDAVPN